VVTIERKIMSKTLIIVESPTKVKTIKKFIEKNFTIDFCLGHLVDLPVKELGVEIENDFKPHYVVIPKRKKVLTKLKNEAKQVQKIFVATDPDREGEAIAWHLSRQFSKSCPQIFRVSFNEITKRSVLKALDNPGKINEDKVNAQQTRRILDRIVGYTLSPLLWVKVGKGLSAGRVQSVAVRLICEREQEIKDFAPQEYWVVEGEFEKKGYPSFTAKLDKRDGVKVNIPVEEEARKIVNELKPESFWVSDIEKKQTKKSPPPPFITSTMQQEAASRLGFPAKFTMSVTQQLYEGIELGREGSVGLITYMRTDSVRVAREAQIEAREFISNKFGQDFLPESSPQYKSKRGQGAHEAIRPTSMNYEPEKIKQFLSQQQYKLYRLIWNRFIASQMKPARLETTSISIQAKDYIFRTSSSEVKFSGYQILYQNGQRNNKVIFPPLTLKEKVKLCNLTPSQHFTQPPPRYTEASLVRILEEKGIGRPSTYAIIVSTIQQRDYVRKDSACFYPTELGNLINDLLVKNFPRVLNVEFTANLEDELDNIEEGKSNWLTVLKKVYNPFKKHLDEARKKVKRVNHIEVTDEICEKCGRKMVIKIGKFGKFISCSGYPYCKNSRSLTLGIPCPEPDCLGEIVERRTKKGRVFYGCSEYPKCKFSLTQKPVKKVCPQCGAPFLIEKRTTHSHHYICIKKECSYWEKVKKENGN